MSRFSASIFVLLVIFGSLGLADASWAVAGCNSQVSAVSRLDEQARGIDRKIGAAKAKLSLSKRSGQKKRIQKAKSTIARLRAGRIGLVGPQVNAQSDLADCSSDHSALGGESITSISEKYIFRSSKFSNFEGEGFFLSLVGQRPLFVVSDFSANPHDIENMRRRIQAVQRGIGKLTYAESGMDDVYLELKSALGVENMLLSPGQYHQLAGQVQLDGKHQTVSLVHFEDIEIKSNDAAFFCKDITAVDQVDMTTGGSVYVFGLHFADGTNLNIGDATINPEARANLDRLKNHLSELTGSDCVITATDVQFQDPIYEVHGVESGWVANMRNVEIGSSLNRTHWNLADLRNVGGVLINTESTAYILPLYFNDGSTLSIRASIDLNDASILLEMLRAQLIVAKGANISLDATKTIGKDTFYARKTQTAPVKILHGLVADLGEISAH